MRRLRPACWLTLLAWILISPAVGFANQTAVTIEAPSEAQVGSEITITVHVTHEGNNFFHYTDWVWLKAGDQEIARWAFEASKRPEAENFTRQVRYRVTGPVVFTASGHCNIHGSAGPARAEVAVASTTGPVGAVKDQTSARPSAGRAASGKIVSGLGIINLALCGFQVATGRRWIKVKIAVHRRTGQALLALAAVHGGLAMLMNW
jgi:desulfoferrodoxin (superoxide reductase-like protein)